MGKKYTKAIAPKDGKIAPYLTNGKAYDIVKRCRGRFLIFDDVGDKLWIKVSRCLHLHGQRWELLVKEDQATQSKFDKSFIPFIAFTTMFLSAVAAWVVLNWNH